MGSAGGKNGGGSATVTAAATAAIGGHGSRCGGYGFVSIRMRRREQDFAIRSHERLSPVRRRQGGSTERSWVELDGELGERQRASRLRRLSYTGGDSRPASALRKAAHFLTEVRATFEVKLHLGSRTAIVAFQGSTSRIYLTAGSAERRSIGGGPGGGSDGGL